MFTIMQAIKLNRHTENSPALIDMTQYRLPQDREAGKIAARIHPVLPTKTGAGGPDIYDFEAIFNDPETKKIIREGNTIGCFYIESPGMRSLLKRLDCDTFEMLTAASSVIRPGVAESGMMREFIERHKDPSKRKYLLPEMETYLGETYGVMIYQEDVIKVAHHIAGLTLEEADLLRRAMSGKMRSHKAMELIHHKFISSSIAKGISPAIAKELWRQVESFAGYAFCKAHSASFALLSFQVAYLKAHHTAEFMASVLSNGGGFYSPAVYLQETRRWGVKVLLPCVNESMYEYTGQNKTLRIGLMAVKNLSRSTIRTIIDERRRNGKYESLFGFFNRTGIGPKESELLIACGALDFLGKTRPSMLRVTALYFKYRKSIKDSLFNHERFFWEDDVLKAPEYTVYRRCAIEYETFGYFVSRHPLEFLGDMVNHPSIVKAADLHKHPDKTVKMLGWYMTSKRIKTRKGEIMKFISLEDLTGTFELVLFPKTYSIYAEQTLSAGAYLAMGKVDLENGNNIIVEKLKVITVRDLKGLELKDSAEKKYYGDNEKVYEEEFAGMEDISRRQTREVTAGAG